MAFPQPAVKVTEDSGWETVTRQKPKDAWPGDWNSCLVAFADVASGLEKETSVFKAVVLRSVRERDVRNAWYCRQCHRAFDALKLVRNHRCDPDFAGVPGSRAKRLARLQADQEKCAHSSWFGLSVPPRHV